MTTSVEFHLADSGG